MREAAPALALAVGLAMGSGLPGGSEAALWGSDVSSVQASNLLEYQVGRDPSVEADELTKLFDQFILDTTHDNLRLGLRVESYRPSENPPYSDPVAYDKVTQKYAQWSSPDLTVHVGNGYVMLGRGLILRAFELPGVVRDATVPRARYAESRDLDGVIIRGRYGRFAVTGLSGRPVINPDLPYSDLEFFQRRTGVVSGSQVTVDAGRGVGFGASYLRSAVTDRAEDISGINLDLRPGQALPVLAATGFDLHFYGEYASRNWRPLRDGLATTDGTPHALYTATELAYGSWGASFETKRYHQFALRMNDPPSLVPELSHRLLNRATHVLLAGDETGAQLVVQGGLPHGCALRANWAQAVNRYLVDGFYAQAKRYDLYFVSLETSSRESWQLEIYGSLGQDEVEGITGQHLLGALGTVELPAAWSVTCDLEFQQSRRRVVLPSPQEQRFGDLFASVGVGWAGRGSLALLGEFSNDPLQKDNPVTPQLETEPRHWLGVAVNWQVDDNHEANIFGGRRRGGLACTSGTCYEVPDFSGMELRLVSRF